MLRIILGIVLLALVLRTLAGCTINVITPPARTFAPPPPRPGVNPCGLVNCNRPNTRGIV